MSRVIGLVACVLILACSGTATPSATSPTLARSVAPTVAPANNTRNCAPIPSGVTVRTASVELAKGGVVQLALRPDKAPNTVATFISKANSGFYNSLTFHRVVADFVVQGGDPKGDGTGGGTQATELSDLPFCKGSLGIARGGDIKVSNDSQWFICTGSCRHLDNQYTNFGQVTSGMDVALGIRVGDKIKSIKIG